MDRRFDLAVAAACVVLGVALEILARGARGTPMIRDPLGPGGMLRVLGAFIALGGLLIVVRRLLAWKQQSTHEVAPEGSVDEPGHPSSALRALGLWSMLALYMLALPRLGYVVVTPVALGVALWVMGIRSPLQLVGVSVGFTAGVWGLFDGLLNVRLPQGLLQGLLAVVAVHG